MVFPSVGEHLVSPIYCLRMTLVKSQPICMVNFMDLHAYHYFN